MTTPQRDPERLEGPTESQRTTSSAGLIGLTAFGGALIGFVLQLLIAYYFGANADTDAYFMAQSTSEMLSKLLMGGSITAVFLPMFVHLLTKGQRNEAWQVALNLLHIIGFIFIILVAALGIFAQPFVAFIAPGFDSATQHLTVNLIRVLLPSFALLFFVELTTSMLHALKQFAIPARLRLIAPLTLIIVLLLSARSLGIYALAVGAVVSAAIQLSYIIWGLARQGFRYHFTWQPSHPALRHLLYLVYPFILSMLATQGAGIVYRILVSELSAGSLSALKYAEKITQFLTIIFLSSVTTVIYPLLSEKASRKDAAGMRDTIGSAIRLITFITIPLTIGVVILRQPFVRLAFERGSFSAHDTLFTSVALLFFVLGLTINGISSVLGHATLALQESRAAVAVTVASQAVAISLFIIFVPLLAHAGLALAAALVPLSIALLYYLYLTRFIPDLRSVFWHRTYAKIVVLGALLTIIMVITHRFASRLPLPSGPATLLELFIPAVCGALAFFGGAYLWQIPEMHEVVTIIRGKLHKWTSR